MKKEDIHIRDPFILTDTGSKTYYLYGTTDLNCWDGVCTGFDVYSSNDLEEYEGPFPAFRSPPDFWADQNYWAPEVHPYQGKYYMFASFKAEGVCRGTQVLIADSPKGPFHPHSDGPLTPRNWECLDGTLFVDDQNNPWLVFCHEWLQCEIGEICAIPLAKDLKSALNKTPYVLFRATDAPWVTRYTFSSTNEHNGKSGFVTDGPFLFRTDSNKLLMLWSSFGTEGYAIGLARSMTGSILGPWQHDLEPLFKNYGGHAMVFSSFDDKKILTMHRPNISPEERPHFFELEEKDEKFSLKK